MKKMKIIHVAILGWVVFRLIPFVLILLAGIALLKWLLA